MKGEHRSEGAGDGGSVLDQAELLYNRAISLAEDGRNAEAIAVLATLVERFSREEEPEVRLGVISALIYRASIQRTLGKYNDAIVDADEAIARAEALTHVVTDASVGSSARGHLGRGLDIRASALASAGRFDEAALVFHATIDRLKNEDDPQLQALVAHALNSLANIADTAGDHAKALGLYDEVVTRFGNPVRLETSSSVAQALRNAGSSLNAMDRHEEALARYDRLLAMFQGSSDPSIQRYVRSGLFNRGRSLEEIGELDRAASSYRTVVEFSSRSGGDSESLAALAMVGEGRTLVKNRNYDAATRVLDRVISRFGGSQDPEVFETVGWALVWKGTADQALGRLNEALAVYRSVETSESDREQTAPAGPKIFALINIERILFASGKFGDARDVYEELESLYGTREDSQTSEAIAAARDRHRGPDE